MSAAYNISGWWLLFGIAVYAVPICIFLHERRWLRSLVYPVLTMLRRCPFYMFGGKSTRTRSCSLERWSRHRHPSLTLHYGDSTGDGFTLSGVFIGLLRLYRLS